MKYGLVQAAQVGWAEEKFLAMALVVAVGMVAMVGMDITMAVILRVVLHMEMLICLVNLVVEVEMLVYRVQLQVEGSLVSFWI